MSFGLSLQVAILDPQDFLSVIKDNYTLGGPASATPIESVFCPPCLDRLGPMLECDLE
jgi:hypothetical protein